MKTIAYIICVFKTLPLVVELEMQNFTEHLKQFSEREKRWLQQKQIIETIRTLDMTKDETKQALNKAIEGDNAEVIRVLVQYIQKYAK